MDQVFESKHGAAWDQACADHSGRLVRERARMAAEMIPQEVQGCRTPLDEAIGANMVSA